MMEISLYCTDDKDNSPFENYIQNKISKSNKKIAESFQIEIITKCLYVAENNGITNDHYTKKLRDYDYIEIRVKQSSLLIRIPYCIDSENNRIVLLSAFDKPDNKDYKQKDKRRIKKELDKAQEYYEDYINNKNNCKYF